MSVRTTADEKVDETLVSVTKAIEAMREVVETDCWGWNDFTAEAKDNFCKVLRKLRKVQRLLM